MRWRVKAYNGLIDILLWHTMGNSKYSKLRIEIDQSRPKRNTSEALI